MPQELFNSQLTGVEKASILLIAMGTKSAGEVLQHLSPDEVQRLCAHVAKQKSIEPNVQEIVVHEFAERQVLNRNAGGMAVAKELLEQVLGPKKAKEILDEIAAGSTGRPFEWLRGTNLTRLANVLQHERPQTITLTLANLPSDQAAEVMTLMPAEIQGDVAYRLTSMQPVAQEIVRIVDDVLRDKILRDDTGLRKAVGGLQSLVTIINSADRTTENTILRYLDEVEAKIAEDVRQMMFAFEDIITLDNKTMQTIIRDLEPEDLRLSLKGTSQEIRQSFLSNMSERAATTLTEDLELMGPVKAKDVEAARKRVISIVRRLEDDGEITLRPDAEEMIA